MERETLRRLELLNQLALTEDEKAEALAYFGRLQEELRQKTEAYEKAYGPLTVMGANTKKGWEWVATPWPWESEA